MTEQWTMTGPAQLRLLAQVYEQSAAAVRKAGWVAVSSGPELCQLAALWEADLSHATGLIADATLRAERAEAALEVAQAKADVIGGQACAEARAAGRGPCGCCAWCVKQATERAERAEAALNRARALLAELEWCGVDNWLECPWCLGAKAEHYGEPAGHKPDCKLAAFLADASGGAA